jgi:hypothetical protein
VVRLWTRWDSDVRLRIDIAPVRHHNASGLAALWRLNTCLSGSMNMTIPDSFLKPALILSLIAFVLCIIVFVCAFVGLTGFAGAAALVLTLGVFPLWIGAVLIFAHRKKGRSGRDWVPILFLGLPSWFSRAHRLYFLLIFLSTSASFVQAFRGQRGWMALLVVTGFFGIPSVFYSACVGAYWSELRVRHRGTLDVPADAAEPPAR